VVDPVALVQEINGLKKLGVRIDRNLLVSDAAHLVLPYHRALDEQRELRKGVAKIGTTKRGIGPAYGDKAARTGLRVSDLMQPRLFSKKLEAKMRENNAILRALGAKPNDFREVNQQYLAAGAALSPFVANTVVYLHRALQSGREILFEGAQGTFLDIDHGTYPYVTSSNTTAGGACTGSGVPAAPNGSRGWGDESVHDAGGRRTAPDRRREFCQKIARNGARIRRDHRAGPPLWLVRCRGDALRHDDQWD
jgi:adenylosuccinate synthase